MKCATSRGGSAAAAAAAAAAVTGGGGGGATHVEQWRGSSTAAFGFVASPAPNTLSPSNPSRPQLCRLKSSHKVARLQAVLAAPRARSSHEQRGGLRRSRARQRWPAGVSGGEAAGIAGGAARSRGGFLSSAAPQTLADPVSAVAREIDRFAQEAFPGRDIVSEGEAVDRIVDMGLNGVLLAREGEALVGVVGAEFDAVQEVEEDVKERSADVKDPDSRKFIMKLSKLAQEGEWRRALEVLRAKQTMAMRARMVAREAGVDVEPPSSLAVEGIAYNATLAALSKAGQWQEAIMLMREMKTRGIERDHISFSSVIAACGRGMQWKKALDFLAELRAEGIAPNAVVYCSAIDACAKGRQWQRALVLLREMEVVDLLPPNLVCMNSAIDACAKAGRPREALALLARMRRMGVVPNEVSYLSAISACSKAGDWQEALRLLEEMTDNGIRPDLKCYSSAIAACGNGGRWELAVDLLDGMWAAGTPPNVVCYNAAISACGKGKQWSRAVGLLQSMREHGIEPDLISYNAVIDACGRSEMWKEGLHLLDLFLKLSKAPREPGALARRSPAPDATTYCAAITGCSRGKQWREALRLLEDMGMEGIAPSEAAYQAALAACAKMGRWKECIVTLERMRVSGVTPRVMAYNSVITACGRGGEWQRALAVLQQMSSRGATPDTITFNAAMAACTQSGQWRQARSILDFLLNPDDDTVAELFLGLKAQQVQQRSVRDVSREGKEGSSVYRASTGSLPSSFSSSRPGGGGSGSRWPPRPDAVSFHVVMKALASAGMWMAALEVLEEMRKERQRILQSARPDEVRMRGEKLWALDIERFRSIFRPGGRWNESLEADPDTLDGMPFRAEAMQVLMNIENDKDGVTARARL